MKATTRSAFAPCSAPTAGNAAAYDRQQDLNEDEHRQRQRQQHPPAVEPARKREQEQQDPGEEDQGAEDPVESEAVIPLLVREGLLRLLADLVGGVEGAAFLLMFGLAGLEVFRRQFVLAENQGLI